MSLTDQRKLNMKSKKSIGTKQKSFFKDYSKIQFEKIIIETVDHFVILKNKKFLKVKFR